MELSNYNTGTKAPSHNLEFSTPIRPLLTETAKWANFLSIMGFIGVGFMVLAALFFMFFGSMIPTRTPGGTPSFGIGLLYLLLSALYAVPIYYLNKFAANCRMAIQTNNQESLVRAFEFLKSHYKFLGIMTIVILALYALFFLILIFTGAAFMHSFH